MKEEIIADIVNRALTGQDVKPALDRLCGMDIAVAHGIIFEEQGRIFAEICKKLSNGE